MNKTYSLIVLTAGIALSCDNPFHIRPLGPTQIKITVTGGTKPLISWEGGPVHFVAVHLNDSLMTDVSLVGSITKRKPTVWGYRSFTDTGEDSDGIASPVQFGSVIAHTTDISNSAYRTESLIPGVKYQIRLATTGPGSAGVIIYSP